MLGTYLESLEESDFLIDGGKMVNGDHIPIKSISSLMSTKSNKVTKKRVLENQQTLDAFIRKAPDETAKKRKVINEITLWCAERSKSAKKRGNPKV